MVVSLDQLNRHGISIIVPLTSSDKRRFRVATAVADADIKVLDAVLTTLREMFAD